MIACRQAAAVTVAGTGVQAQVYGHMLCSALKAGGRGLARYGGATVGPSPHRGRVAGPKVGMVNSVNRIPPRPRGMGANPVSQVMVTGIGSAHEAGSVSGASLSPTCCVATETTTVVLGG